MRMYGQPNFATRAGAMLQKAVIPFGVDGGTRSSAADRIITYNTRVATHSTNSSSESAFKLFPEVLDISTYDNTPASSASALLALLYLPLDTPLLSSV
jgi:hypothetical protein